MPHKRFALLAGVLVTLNLVLWLAPQGLALREIALAKLFGPRLVRAEIIDRAGTGKTVDWRLDRGVIVSATATSLILSEADGRQQTIGVDASTTVLARGRRLALGRLAPGWRVLVTWQANSANGLADTVKVESRHKAKGNGKGPLNSGASSSYSPVFHLS